MKDQKDKQCRFIFTAAFAHINLIPALEIAWEFFYNIFSALVDKHAPLKSYRVKGRGNAWFSPLLSNMLHEGNLAWAKARKTDLHSDWLDFRRLRNACTVAVRKAKAEHFLIQTSNNLNNSSKFWKTVKSSTENNKGIELPSCIMKGSHAIDKEKMLNCFNEHFIASGFLFDSIYGAHANSLIVQSENFMSSQSFNFSPVAISEVCKALKFLDASKSAGPDKLEPYFLKGKGGSGV